MSYENNTRYVPGQWNVHCDVCGFKFKSGQIRKRWDGLMVCSADWETDHPQKYIKVNETSQIVPYVRKESSDYQFINVCTLYGISGYAGLATAGCAQAGNNTFSYTFLLDLKNAGVV
jgi:hypothetical protein